MTITFLICFSMEPFSRLDKHSTRQRYSNVIRESDIRADPEYKQKKEFYDKLKIFRLSQK